MDDKQSDRIICEGGLDSTQNHLKLSLEKPGAATRLINYEVGLDGGYRRINGFETYHTSAVPGEGKVLGVMIFDNTLTGITEVIAARKDVGAATYSLYEYDSGGPWILMTTGLTLSSSGVERLRYDVGNDGFQNILAFVDGVNKAVLYDGTDFVQIDSAATGLGFATAGGAMAVDAPSIVSFFSSTLFIGGDPEAKGVVAYSSPNAFFDFLVANGAGQATAGFEVVQIKPFRESLFMFGRNSIKRAEADVTAGFLVKNVTTNIGCVSPDSVIEIGGDLIFLAPDGFRPISGTNKIGDVQLEVISKPIHNLLRGRIAGGLGDSVSSVVIRGKSQFRVFFSSAAVDEVNSRGIIGALRTADQQAGWEFSEILGFKASCATSQYVNGVELVLHGGFDGFVYQQEVGNTLNGSDMLAVYATPYLDFGDTEIRKVSEKLSMFLKASDNMLMTLDIEYDWGDRDSSPPVAYTLDIESSNASYGDGTLYGDGSTYGGVVPVKIVKNIEGSFFSIKATYSTYGDIDPYSIHGAIFEYSAKGRR